MKTILLFGCICASFLSFGQNIYSQYFEGADTAAYNSILIEMDTSNPTNIWQIGPPQKVIFDAAQSVPNVIVTDTINGYPISDTSRFITNISYDFFQTGIMAFRWMQKLDYDTTGYDGGLIEYTTDNGATWVNAFDNGYVYNFYGFDMANVDTVGGPGGPLGLVGRDTNWREVWLCFDYSWLQQFPNDFKFRFTSMSDDIGGIQGYDGWMIDNMGAMDTWQHTLEENPKTTFFTVGPNPSTDKIYIESKKVDEYHIIEKMILRDANGKVVKHFEMAPTKFNFDISDVPEGVYYLKIQTNLHTETFTIVVQQ
jgi:hypothetical protein